LKMDAEILEACKPQFVAAADWWMNKLAGFPGRDAGFTSSDDPSGAMTRLMLLAASHAKAATTQQLLAFRDNLSDWLYQSYLKKVGTRYGHLSLYCDYGPGWELWDIAKPLGIDDQRFPIKTCMWLDPGFVRVRCGYGADTVTIYPQPFADLFSEKFKLMASEKNFDFVFDRRSPGGITAIVKDRYNTFECLVADKRLWTEDVAEAATRAALLISEMWKYRERIQCHWQIDHRSMCWEGYYYDYSGKHECPECRGMGYTKNPNAQRVVAQ
jgi:hypothetical protein